MDGNIWDISSFSQDIYHGSTQQIHGFGQKLLLYLNPQLLLITNTRWITFYENLKVYLCPNQNSSGATLINTHSSQIHLITLKKEVTG